MKKLFVSVMFLGLTTAAMAGNPPTNTVAGDNCRDLGVSVQQNKNSVQVNSPSNVDYNMRVTTNNNNSYEYDTRNGTSNDNGYYDAGKRVNTSAQESYSGNEGVKNVDIRCYERK